MPLGFNDDEDGDNDDDDDVVDTRLLTLHLGITAVDCPTNHPGGGGGEGVGVGDFRVITYSTSDFTRFSMCRN